MTEANGYRQRIVELARQFIAGNALIIDTETTGLNKDDQVVEIAIIDSNETIEFSALIKPSKPIPPDATRIHGITNEMVASAMPAADLWPMVHMIMCGSALLAYNAPFDSQMVEQTFGPEARGHEWHCLMNAWMEFHGLERWQRLDNACYQIGVPVGGHRAMGDAKAAREVLRWLARQGAEQVL